MIISEKQIMQLIDVAYKFGVFLHAKGDHQVANGLEGFLESIANQQSDELKVISNED